MKPKEKKNIKGRCRVLPNVVKKSEKSLNGSGNRSFFNKSNSHYIADLRMNNARLAHSLAAEKSKFANFFQRYTDSQSYVMSCKGFLRSTNKTIKEGLEKFRTALDMMIESTDILYGATASISSFCQEGDQPAEPALVTKPANGASSPQETLHETVTANSTSPSISLASSNHGRSAATVSSIRQYTARPMVKGQVISNPTISLQRVTLPSRHLGKGGVKPDRGVDLSACLMKSKPARLSIVPEVLNEPNANVSSDSSLSPTSAPPPEGLNLSLPSPTVGRVLSLPQSHVLLERISSDVTIPPTNLSSLIDSMDQMTVVHFGSLNFSSLSTSEGHEEALSPSKSLKMHCPEKPLDSMSMKRSPSGSNCLESEKGRYAGSSNPPESALKLSKSDESSSDDDDDGLALSIAESKKCYLERNRQVDLMEGTSWNYDDAGKYRKRPPTRKKPVDKSARKNFTTRGSSKVSQSQAVQSESADSSSTVSYSNSDQSWKSEKGQKGESPLLDAESNLNGYLSETTRERKDMTLTACIPAVLGEVANIDSQDHHEVQARRENEQGSSTDDTNEEPSDRTVFVTQRSRGRKLPADNIGNHSLSTTPFLSPRACKLENNENSPPKNEVDDAMVQTKKIPPPSRYYQGLSPRVSYVVLERLSNETIYKNLSHSPVISNAPGITHRTKSSTKDDGFDGKARTPMEAGSKSSMSRKRHGMEYTDSREESCSDDGAHSSSETSKSTTIETQRHDDKVTRGSSLSTKMAQQKSRCKQVGEHDDPAKLVPLLSRLPTGPKQAKKDVVKSLMIPAITFGSTNSLSHPQGSSSAPTSLIPQDGDKTPEYHSISSKLRTDPSPQGSPDVPELPLALSAHKIKPGPKQYKKKAMKALMKETSASDSSNALSLPSYSHAQCSAPTSPASSNGSISSMDSIFYESHGARPRRLAAPASLKEPTLNKKMRRE